MRYIVLFFRKALTGKITIAFCYDTSRSVNRRTKQSSNIIFLTIPLLQKFKSNALIMLSTKLLSNFEFRPEAQ